MLDIREDSTATSSSSSSSSAAATEVSSASLSFVGNTPSTVLFFLALAVGVFIASLFIFFTARYFIRSKYGLHIYPVAQRSFVTTGHNISLMHHTTAELQEQLNYIRANHFIRSEFFDRRLNNRRRRRRRRGRFSKMKKLTEAQVEQLFPKKTYYDWLNGGQERDHVIRDGVLQEEEMASNPNKVTSVSSSESPVENATEGIEMSQLQANPADYGLQFTSGNCAICLENIEDEDIVRGLLCGHVFHAECLDPWLTRRRACCPMCKRDYYFKDGTSPDSEQNNQQNHQQNELDRQNNSNNDRNEHHDDNDNNAHANNAEEDNQSDTDSIDVEVFRNDPAMRAMLQELVPIEERVRMVLEDESLSHLGLEEQGREIADRKYGGVFKVIFWKMMGISKQDLFNYGVITAYHDYRVAEERRITSMPDPDQDQALEPETSHANQPDQNQAQNPSLDSHQDPIQSQQETDLADQTSPAVSPVSSASVHTAPSASEQDLANITIPSQTRRDANDNRV